MLTNAVNQTQPLADRLRLRKKTQGFDIPILATPFLATRRQQKIIVGNGTLSSKSCYGAGARPQPDRQAARPRAQSPPSAVCPSGTLHSHCAAQIWHKKRPRWRPKRVDYMPKSSGKIPPTRARNSGPKISGHIKGSGDSHGLQDSVLAARPTYQSRRPMWIVHTFGPDQFFGPFRSKLTAARWAKKNLISASNAVTIMRAMP